MCSSSNPLRVSFSSTAFKALEPISSPTTLFFFLPSMCVPRGRCSTGSRRPFGGVGSQNYPARRRRRTEGAASNWGRGEKLGDLRGRGAPKDFERSRARIKSLQSLKYQMILCDAPLITPDLVGVNN